MTIDEYTNTIHEGHASTVLQDLPQSSVHCCITSPPYYLKRDYGEHTNRIWDANPRCDHDWGDTITIQERGRAGEGNTGHHSQVIPGQDTKLEQGAYCHYCGGWYGQLGLEPTPEMYIDHLLNIFREVQRVLRDDGVLWINIDDKYTGSGMTAGKPENHDDLHNDDTYPDTGPITPDGLKNKSLMAIPERLVIGLLDQGWVYRTRGVWYKPNPMPGPWQDRLTHVWEPFYMFTPNSQYWWDLDAIREPFAESTIRDFEGGYGRNDDHKWNPEDISHHGDGGIMSTSKTREEWHNLAGKNPGDVFEIPTEGYPEAHYAIFPEDLVVNPVQSSCPPRVCSECGAGYERIVREVPSWEQDRIERPQLKQALAMADQAGLTEEHFEAARAVGFSDAGEGKATQQGSGNNSAEVIELAAEAKDVLGGYFREFRNVRVTTDEWTKPCECDSTDTDPGIVLDPFAGRGTTCKVAAEYGRRYVGIDLDPESIDLAEDFVPGSMQTTFDQV